MRSLHVLTRKEDLDPAHIADEIIIVLDGTIMAERGLVDEVRFAAEIDHYARVPSLRQGRIS